MKWGDALQELLDRVGGIERINHIPEEQAMRVARLFFDQEVYPRMLALRNRLISHGYEVLLQPSEPPPEGMTWNIEAVDLLVYLPEGSGLAVPLATLRIEYNINFICGGAMNTKEGRTNSLTFTLLGEPITHVESWIQDLQENLGASS